MSEVKIEDYKGYEVYYNSGSMIFYASDGEGDRLSAETQKNIEAQIDRKSKKVSTRIPFIKIESTGNYRAGDITSNNASTKELWVSITEGDYGKGRSQYSNYDVNNSTLYKDTPDNRAILSHIKEIRSEIASKYQEIKDLVETMQFRITPETLGWD